MLAIGSPGSRRIAPCWSETCLKSRSRSARVSGGSAASRRLSRWPWASVSARIRLLSCLKAERGWRWFLEIGRRILPARIGVGEGGSHCLRASQHLGGGDAARDDFLVPGDLPVPVVGRTVR